MNNASESREEYFARVERAVTFMTEHLARDLRLEHIAAAAHFSPFHFHRIFTAMVGETPRDFLNRIRLEKAANKLIKSPSQTITEVALACGFSSSSAFARSFKKHFGRPAGAYRKEQRGRLRSLHPHPDVRVGKGDAALENTLRYEMEVKTMPRFHVAYVSNLKGYSLPEICKAWERLTRWAGARDLLRPETKSIGMSFDDPRITPDSKCRYYACITVPEEMSFDSKMGFMDIELGKYAVMHLTCSAEQIQLAYRTFFVRWFPESGYQPADRPSYEIYHDTPDTHPAGLFVMDICMPVMPL